MESIMIDLTITPDHIISVGGIAVTIVIAIISGIYAIATNTKKYELSECYRTELLDWYSATVEVMVEIIHHIQSGSYFDQAFLTRKTELLSRLSKQVEIGRFYYPNVIKHDRFGEKKPSSYQGYRDITLEFLLHFYKTAANTDSNECVELLWDMERHYTALIFDRINPRERNKRYSKYTEFSIPEGSSIEDYIRENPEKIAMFL